MSRLPTSPLDSFDALVQIIDELRHPQTGCPWDLEQDLNSLTRFTLEEAYEYIDAVYSKKPHLMAEELGDLLLQIVLNAKVASQEKKFQLSDVLSSINQKMIRRHPHVFNTEEQLSSSEVLKRWEEIKKLEKQESLPTPFSDIPKAMPALTRSAKIGKRSQKHNFDWQNAKDVMKKVREELSELEEVYLQDEHKEIEHEVGDLLFSVAQLARHCSVDPEEALIKCNLRFEQRFLLAQSIAEKDNKLWSDLDEDHLNLYWEKAKKELKGKE